ncbi:MAG: peptidoglycan DD-metalloendopeptidase family protein [Eubacterium sp.]|nr:peptidoglycan DD-metalloendopeptidase family protein [Eubacterium sp.]
MVNVFLKLLNMSFSASLLILACIFIRYTFKGMPKHMRCFLWLLVLVRLACPFYVESPLSVLPRKNFISVSETDSDISNSQIDASDNSINMSSNLDLKDSESLKMDQNVKTIANEMGSSDIRNSEKSQQLDTQSNSFFYIRQSKLVGLLSVIWLLGVLATIGYGIISYIRLLKCVDDAVILRDNIFQSDRIVTPFVLGFFRTRIYIPYNLTPTETYFVLSHERAHISRKDHLLKPIAFAVSCIYWFNPLVWIGYMLLCRDIELACDEKAVNLIGYNKKKEYSQSILNLSVPSRYISACPVAFGETGVKERVRSVLNMKKSKKIVIVSGAVLVALTGIGFLTYPKVEKLDVEKNKAIEEFAAAEAEATAKAEVVSEAEEVAAAEAKAAEEAKAEAGSEVTTETVSKSELSNDESSDNDVKKEKVLTSVVTVDPEAEEKVVFSLDGETVKLLDEDGNEITCIAIEENGDSSTVYSNAESSTTSFDEYGSEIDDIEVSLPETENSIGKKTIEVIKAVSEDGDSQSKYVYVISDPDKANGEGILNNMTIVRPFSDDHKGVDLGGKEGDPIYLSYSGKVSNVGYDDERGNFIEIENADGCTIIYNHLKDKPGYKVGDSVMPGDKIGEVGNTGNSTGPHLHISVLSKDGEYIDPQNYTPYEYILEETD